MTTFFMHWTDLRRVAEAINAVNSALGGNCGTNLDAESIGIVGVKGVKVLVSDQDLPLFEAVLSRSGCKLGNKPFQGEGFYFRGADFFDIAPWM